jgi:ribonuclease BN (tRNA processing enzyme)
MAALLTGCAAATPGPDFQRLINPLDDNIAVVVEQVLADMGYEARAYRHQRDQYRQVFLKLRPGPESGSLIHDRLHVTVASRSIATTQIDVPGFVVGVRAETLEELRGIQTVEPSQSVMEDAARFIDVMSELSRRPRGLRHLRWKPPTAAPVVVEDDSPVLDQVSADTADTVDYNRGTHVVLLGTGTPNADPERLGPAVAIVVNGEAYLVDAGTGIVRRAAAAAAARGIAALAPKRLERIFITHLHSDHTLGLPDLILTPWVLERARPLEAYGPSGLSEMVEHLTAAYRADMERRIEGLQPQNATGNAVNVYRVVPGVVYRDANVTVTAFAVDHEAWPEAFGYRFETSDRVVVVSGDTRPTPNVIEACSGCDVLVHEVYSDAGFARREPEWQRYHAAAHTSASDLGRLATRARPALLVLYHQLFWGTSPEDLTTEVARHFDGRVVSGRDLDIF